MTITIPIKKTENNEGLLEEAIFILNHLVDNANEIHPSSPYFTKDGELRINFKTCSNSILHGKLIGILFLYFARPSMGGYIGIYPPAGYISFSNKASLTNFYLFIKELPALSEINIEIK